MFKYTKIWPSRVSPMFSADDSHREEGTPKSWNLGKLPRKRYLNSGNKSWEITWKRQHFLPHIPRITSITHGIVENIDAERESRKKRQVFAVVPNRTMVTSLPTAWLTQYPWAALVAAAAEIKTSSKIAH